MGARLMAFDFPSSPAPGQVFSPANGPVYTYLNSVWLASLGAGPMITSSAARTVAENSAFSHTLTASRTVTFSKIGSADAALFTLSGSSLTMVAKNYEAPIDANGDNIYEVIIEAIDALGVSTMQKISVTVTDVNEGGATFNITDTISDSTDLVSGKDKVYTGKAIGTPASDRIVMLAIQYAQLHQGRANPVVMCDGVEMMLASTCERASNNAPSCIYLIPKPTGMTADFTITFLTGDLNANVPRINGWVAEINNCSLNSVRLHRRQRHDAELGEPDHTGSRHQGRERRPAGLHRRRGRHHRHAD